MARTWSSALPLFSAMTGLWLLGGCGQSAHPPTVSSEPATRAGVIVTFDEKSHGCLVALSSEAQGSAVGCNEVVPFIRDELRVPVGAAYDIRATSTTDAALVAKVEADLKGAGYRSLP